MDNDIEFKTILQENELKFNKYITSRHILGYAPLDVENYHLVRAACFLDEVEVCFSREGVVDRYLSWHKDLLTRGTTDDTFNAKPFYWYLLNLAFLYSLYMPVDDHIRQKLYTALYGSSNKSIDFSELIKKHANKLEQFFKGPISLVMINIITPTRLMKTPIDNAIPLTALLDYILNINGCNADGERALNKLCESSLYPDTFIVDTFYDFVLKNYVGKEKLVENIIHSKDADSSIAKKYDALMRVKEFRDSCDKDVSEEYLLRMFEEALLLGEYDNIIKVENIDNTAIIDDYDAEDEDDDYEDNDDDYDAEDEDDDYEDNDDDYDDEDNDEDEEIIDDIIVEDIVNDGRFIVEDV